MNALIAVVLGILTVYLTYTRYARRIDRNVIRSDPKRATPAVLYMDGVDFMPTNRNILFGYHFKSIAAAGPIVGAIVAATLWGWLPAMVWLILGVAFMGWVSDYSAIVLSVRNEGHSLSAVAHRLISPRTRTVLFLFIFFYLLLVAGAFVGIMAAVMESQPRTHLGMILLVAMGLLLGQMLYRWRVGLLPATLVTVGVTLLAILTGQYSEGAFRGLNEGLNALTGGAPLVTYFDPMRAGFKGGEAAIKPSLLFWALAISAFCYAGSILPIWRLAQPVVYVGFWITAMAMLLGLGGAAVGTFTRPEAAYFAIPAFKGWSPQLGPAGVMPLWPMLFVTIACGAISGWHALFGTVGTARQIENEADMLPVGAGSMLAEFLLGLLALLAVSVGSKGSPDAAFADGLGGFISVWGVPRDYAVSLAFAAFIVIVLVVTQLLFRVMRVTLTEWLGEILPPLRNQHVASLLSIALAIVLVLTGTWIYLWQLFGAANQLMAALSLLLVTVWLVSVGKQWLYAGLPMIAMYVTTVASIGVTAYNLYFNVYRPNMEAGRALPAVGSGLMIVVAVLLIAAALLIGLDGARAFVRHFKRPAPSAEPVAARS
ncbi:MAG TPA: carbon starvation CstA family protein [candidate division Zixibacteria bacterium]|nr:carbon starvation CstA family protein [candidate division Zixibacteria bacterium]